MKVLIVDNSNEIRTLLQDIITSRNHKVELAESGEALQKYATKPDVVTLDLGMPGAWMVTTPSVRLEKSTEMQVSS